MSLRRREIRGAVVVITGASSGIGCLAAATLARRGTRVVLAAREKRTLATPRRSARRRAARRSPSPPTWGELGAGRGARAPRVFEPREELNRVAGDRRERRRHRYGGPFVAAGAAAKALVER